MSETVATPKPQGFQPKRAALVAAGLAAIIGYAFFSGTQGSTAYTCDSLVPEIVSLSEQNQSALLPVKLIDLAERKSISTTDTRVECSGIGILSNGLKATVNYRAYVEYDKWWIKYEPVGIL